MIDLRTSSRSMRPMSLSASLLAMRLSSAAISHLVVASPVSAPAASSSPTCLSAGCRAATGWSIEMSSQPTCCLTTGLTADRVYLSDSGWRGRCHIRAMPNQSSDPIYAPEQFNGEHDIDGRCDQYALRSIHDIHRSSAVYARPDPALMYAHLRERPPLLSDRRGIPLGGRGSDHRWQDAGDRYPTAGVGDDLRKAFDGARVEQPRVVRSPSAPAPNLRAPPRAPAGSR